MNPDDASRAESWLVLRAQSGDRTALDTLFRNTQDWLHRFLLRVVEDRHTADDLLQSVFMIIYHKLRFLREPRVYRSWVYRIAAREAFHRLKHLRRFQTVADPAAEPATPADPPSIDQETRGRLQREIFRLPPNTRTAVVLHYYEAMSIKRVADVLGLALGTVKSRIAYGLSLLRKELTEENSS